MAIERHVYEPGGPPPDDEIVDAEVVEEREDVDGEEHEDVDGAAGGRKVRGPGRARRLLHERRPELERQRDNVKRRLADWFRAADVTDARLAEQVEARRRRNARQEEAHLAAQVRRLRAQAARRGDRGALMDDQIAHAQGELDAFRAERKEVHLKIDSDVLIRARYGRRATRAAIAALGGLALSQGIAAEPVVALASLGGAPVAWWWLGRPFSGDQAHPGQHQPDTWAAAPYPGSVDLTKRPAAPGPDRPRPEEGPAAAPYGGPPPAAPDFDAPPPPALSEEALNAALQESRCIKPGQHVTVLKAPAWSEDRTAVVVFDLPPGVTVTMLQKRAEALAGALGRDLSMIDLSKAGAAGRCALWMSDVDPFEDPRPSPLLTHAGGVDAWRDGVPVAWAKRGNPIALAIKNSSFVIAGMTRSGKGVGAANLAVGAALDVRINLRIVAGKVNGEFDPYGRTGVAATYFKQRAERFHMLVKALLADLDRRNALLGKLGKSKLTPEVINQIGGLELLVVDELATFTRPGRYEERDELLEDLIQLAAVAAGAGILMVLITQYPEVDVIPQGLAMNCGTRWAMRVDNATQSNAILGGGASAAGRDASKFDPPMPGLGWLVNPFLGVTDLARSFDLDEDERGEVTTLLTRAAELRRDAGRLPGQWDDPIEAHLARVTGKSSAGGGPQGDGIPAAAAHALTDEQQQSRAALVACLEVMDSLGRDAQLAEMADRMGATAEDLGRQLRAAGAGSTTKITVDGRRVQGYTRDALETALDALGGA
ncbi:type IV secretory system conjugative DNA transfer family protein [Streptomyces aculeolatus]